MSNTDTALTTRLQNGLDTARRSLAFARESLQKAAVVGEHYNLETIASELNGVAEAEGRAKAWTRAWLAAQHGATADVIRSEMTDLLLVGADDTWSGRRNDLARARFDGTREGVRSILFQLQVAGV